MFKNLVLYYRIFIYLFKTASIMFLSYILFELLDVEHGSLINTIWVSNCLDPDRDRQNVQPVCKGYQKTKKVSASKKVLI